MLLAWSLTAVMLCSEAAPQCPQCPHEGPSQSTACALSPNNLVWAAVRTQKLTLWQWAAFRIPQGRQMPDQVSERWSCAKSHRPGNTYDGWMYAIQGVVRSGSRRATQGHWAGDNWLKLHQMEDVIMRRVQSGNILNLGRNDLSGKPQLLYLHWSRQDTLPEKMW